jgi:hypothetical protein
MSTQRPMNPTLISPECAMLGCTAEGDQYMMVRCRACGGWFCQDHIQVDEGVRVQTVHLSRVGNLAYYAGICVRCSHARQEMRH